MGTRGRKPSEVWSAARLAKALKAYDAGEADIPANVKITPEVVADNGARISAPRRVEFGPVFSLSADGTMVNVQTLVFLGRNRNEAHVTHATLQASDFAPKGE